MRHSPAFHREPTARRSIALFFCRLHSRRPHEFDDSFSEPVQSEWARVSFLIVRNDLSVVEAEFIRPREWIESLGLVKGARLDLAVPELEIDGLAEVTAVRACPPIAEGEGQVVTGRFVTRDVANVVRITLASGTEIRATDVHPVWSIDREDWVPAGKLEPCEMVDTLAGPVAVASVEQLDRHPAVYNLEVHGEHVYRIAVDGVLVHNAGPGDCLEGLASGAKLPRYEGPKPSYSVNLAHAPGTIRRGKTPLPSDAKEVFQQAVPDSPGKPKNWYGRNKDGQTYRFSGSNDGTAHFSGIDGIGDGIRNITRYARQRLEELLR